MKLSIIKVHLLNPDSKETRFWIGKANLNLEEIPGDLPAKDRHLYMMNEQQQ